MSKANNLVIVESPSKAKTISRYLGPGYTVKASMGHLRDLPKSKMGVDLENGFTPQYIAVRGKESLIKELKADAAKADTVYLATDPDREGEAISWHLKELLGLSDEKAKRVTFNEITQRVVKESIQHPRDIDYDLVDAQQARDHEHIAVGKVNKSQYAVYHRIADGDKSVLAADRYARKQILQVIMQKLNHLRVFLSIYRNA